MCICVNTCDFRDQQDVTRVLKHLHSLGLEVHNYKADVVTVAVGSTQEDSLIEKGSARLG